MSLTDQETRCVRLACDFLSAELSKPWRIADGPTLDDLHPNAPSPEVIIESDDGSQAAIEVKRLTGDAGYRTYKESLLSLNRTLVPTCGGYYYLSPPDDFRLPMDKQLRREIARQIELVAPALKAGESDVLKVERQGYLVFHENSRLQDAHCLHNTGRRFLRPLNDMISGDLFLIDGGLEHSFFTQEGIDQFLAVIRVAYDERKFGSRQTLTWYEEWQIIKTKEDDEDREDGVWIIAVTEARDVLASVEECLDTVLTSALTKFGAKRWAETHVIVLEVESALMSPERSLPVIQGYPPADLTDVDLILLIHDGDVNQAYPIVRSASQLSFSGQQKGAPHDART